MAKCNFILTVALFLIEFCSAVDLKSCRFDQIYQLGDSFGDTGNDVLENHTSVFAKPPYGLSFLDKKPTGRCSDGRLIIDYIAVSSGLPFLPPYKNTSLDTRHGDNFATAGATALNVQMLAAKNITSPITSTSLDVQLDFMFTHFNSICLRDCTEILKSALFLVGEIGFSDYSLALTGGNRRSLQETRSLVPDVVFEIQKAIRKVIEFGAVKIVVPGIFPLGCFPIHLTEFKNTTTAAYDEFGCLKALNDISKYHNQKLQLSVDQVQKDENKLVTIVYGDYYNAYLSLLRDAQKSGSDIKNTRQSCCGGGGGKYNFDSKKMCGFNGGSVCAQPGQYIHWDGIHLTQRAYKQIAQFLIADIAPKLNCTA